MLRKLRESVEIKFGKRIAYQKDCKILSNNILEHKKGVISPSTLRRFFGFLTTNSNPSRATLDTLSEYCGYKNWEDFIAQNESATKTGDPIIDLWAKALNNARYISKKNCDIIKSQNPLGTSNIVTRDFAKERLAYFLNSAYSATSFVGPGGFGKTTLLIDWYEKYISHPHNQNDIVLFLPATAIEGWASKEMYFESWLLSLIDINDNNLFEALKSNPKLAVSRFILIIDALDELSISSSKTEKAYTAIHQLLSQFPASWFKLIVSSRYTSWNQFISQSPFTELWYFSRKSFFSSEGANMPSLNEKEIQKVLDNTINKKYSLRILVEEFPFDLVQLVSYPYYLQLFIEIYKPDNSHLITDKLDLINEFVNKEIYHGQFSDEKLDILNKIIDLSFQDKTFGTIKKNDLKEVYPIHLKLAGNYFNAYNQLLSFGIIAEELVENLYGVLTNKVKISQPILYELLTLRNMIEKRGEISFKIFQEIEKLYYDSHLLPHLISLLFEIAYKRKLVEVLKPFFSLSSETLVQVFQLPNINNILRKDDFMRRELIPIYASDNKARKFLFEGAVDLNTLTTSSRLLLYNYLQHSKLDEEIFLAKTLIYIAGSYELDFSWINKLNEEVPYTTLPKGTPPLIAGLWFSCKTIANHFSRGDGFKNILAEIDNFASNCKWDSKCLYEFELGLVYSMLITKNFDVICNRLHPICKSLSMDSLTSEQKAIIIYYEFAKWRKTSIVDTQKVQKVQGFLNELPGWISFQTLLIAKSWIAIHYLSSGRMDKAYESYRKAVEISNLAGYLVFEVKLLLNLSKTLKLLGEDERALECDAFAKSLIDKAGVDHNLL